MSPQTLLVRLATAAVLGSLVGLERHRSDKAAGLRTHMLVSLGSALVMIVSAYGFEEVIRPARVVLDPSRIAAQVVSGIGFLGAGTILRRNDTVLGLTTAASVWAVAAVGLAAGAGLYLAAAAATALILIILAGIRPLEERIGIRNGHRTFHIVVGQEDFSPESLEPTLRQLDLELIGVQFHRCDKPGERRIAIELGRVDNAKLLGLLARMQGMKGVHEMNFEGGPS
jgi:putative Mg2+ transporter-C (MgtC) family protein